MFSITDFKCEYGAGMLGMGEAHPRFSWITDKNQASFTLTVLCGRRAIWRKTGGSSTLFVPYAGKPLLPLTAYSVRLKAHSADGETAEARLSFETGLTCGFSAGFITTPWEQNDGDCPVFGKAFDIGSVKSARLYITALGLYEARINGALVSDSFAPGCTSYHSRLQYQAYDVTDKLKSSNMMTVTLADGWYKGRFGCVDKIHLFGDRTALLCELHITHRDGSLTVICSDATWRCGRGALLFSCREDGELQDTRLTDTFTHDAIPYEYDKSVIVWSPAPPVRAHEAFKPELIITPSGKRVLDFGQNLSGYVKARLKRKSGTRLVLRHFEALDSNGEMYTENLRKAKCTDEYILNGTLQELSPRFSFRGFRYVCIEGIKTINPDDFTAVALYSDMAETGSFSCSDPDINRLMHNISWSMKGNFLDFPTDCPQRDERLGWTGDAQIFTPTAALLMDVSGFFSKWLADVAAEQTPELGVPLTVPDVFSADGRAAWGDAATIIPWELYNAYGDEGLLRRQYPSVKSWVDYITRHSTGNLWQNCPQYGDWLGMDRENDSFTGATDPDLAASAFYAHSAQLAARAASVLGYKNDARYYYALFNSIRRAYQKEYITSTGRLVCETQTACVLTLAFGLARKKDQPRILKALTDNLDRHNNHLVTGFMGTPLLCGCLDACGRYDLAIKLLLNRDYPSWLYPVRMGATTIWERWNGIKPDGSFETAEMNSFNHYAYGSVGAFMFGSIAGIKRLLPGYKKSLLEPKPAPGLTNASATVKTPYGYLSCSWEVNGSSVTVNCTVPANTTAQLLLPDGQSLQLSPGSYVYTV